MKTKSILLTVAILAVGFSVMAQENDDMYFSSKDRAKINLRNKEEVILASAKANPMMQVINPSDSYSVRNENPDYVAGQKVGSNSNAGSSYFSPNYQPTVNQTLYANNCNCNSGFSNYGYGYNPYGMGYGYNPYYGYGAGYNSYGMGWNSFGYGLGYGMYGMGMGYGSMYGMYGMGYGMYGMGYGYGMYGYPYYGYSPYYGYGGYGYPSTVVVSSGDHSGPVYGRHPSRTSSATSNYFTSGRTTGRGNAAYYNGNGTRSSLAARSASNSNSSYYSNAWRQSAANTRGNSWTNSGSNSRGSFWSNFNSGNNNSGTRTWSNPSTPAHSSWGGNSGFSGGGMRSSGFSGGGFSGGGGGHVGGGGGHGRR